MAEGRHFDAGPDRGSACTQSSAARDAAVYDSVGRISSGVAKQPDPEHRNENEASLRALDQIRMSAGLSLLPAVSGGRGRWPIRFRPGLGAPVTLAFRIDADSTRLAIVS